MKPHIYAPQLPLLTRTGSPGLDIVVPFTTRPLTRAALAAAGRLSAELLPLIRMVRTQVVPFPLQLTLPRILLPFQLASCASRWNLSRGNSALISKSVSRGIPGKDCCIFC